MRSCLIVISQPMYFPWVGMLEQIRLANHFVFYDDVQFSKGSFVNRVQIKTAAGIKWLTVPVRDLYLGQRIQDVQIDFRQDWRRQHLDMLEKAYATAPYLDDMLRLVKDAFDANPKSMGDLSRLSMLILCDYFGLKNQTCFQDIQTLDIPGTGSSRVLEIVLRLGGNTYVTGHGARNYLDHECFERAGVDVRYMNYSCTQYRQLHGQFTPYVSALDLVANCGFEGEKLIRSTTINWKDFLNEPK